MKHYTDLFCVNSLPQNKFFSQYVTTTHWQLWFTEAENNPYRHMHVEEHTFPVKPTKKQIRRLRRQFRKFSML